MKPMRHVVVRAALALFLVIAMAGCVTAWIPDYRPAKSGGKAGGAVADPKASREIPFPRVSNNSTIMLEAAEYVGDLTLRANKVTIIGRGPGATSIRGRVTIVGNNCTMSQLTIRGPVLINGNNADLRAARIEGKVSSTGKNNAW
jgi:hypothetical protein